MEQITDAAQWVTERVEGVPPVVFLMGVAALTLVWLLSRNPKGTLLTTTALLAFFVWQDPGTAQTIADVDIPTYESKGFRPSPYLD